MLKAKFHSLKLVAFRWGLALGLLHLTTNEFVELLESVKGRHCRTLGLDTGVVVNVMEAQDEE